MKKEYIVELRVRADAEDIERYGSIQDMILDSTRSIPYTFDIEDCREAVE